MAKLPTTNTRWVLICPVCGYLWREVVGRGRWVVPMNGPRFPALRVEGMEVPPARAVHRRASWCLPCLEEQSLYWGMSPESLDDLRAQHGPLGYRIELVNFINSSRRREEAWQHCRQCGRRLEGAGRSTRRYCSTACKSRAQRRRERFSGELTPNRASEYLGGRMKARIARATEGGELPCIERGGRRYYRADDLNAWLESRLRPSKADELGGNSVTENDTPAT